VGADELRARLPAARRAVAAIAERNTWDVEHTPAGEEWRPKVVAGQQRSDEEERDGMMEQR
jgi:hypothetical protein